MTDADLLEALRDCYDPILKRNIVDLGLVRSATLTPDHEAPGVGMPPRYIAHITTTASSSDDTVAAQLHAQIANRLAGLQQISRTDIALLPPPFPILR